MGRTIKLALKVGRDLKKVGKHCVRVSRWGKDVAQTCWSSFLSHFRGRSLSSQLDASAIMSLVMFKGNFERIEAI